MSKTSKASEKKASSKKTAPPRKQRKDRSLSVLLLSGFMAVVVMLVLAGGLLIWRLSTSPLDISFAKDYIENALNSDNPERRVELSKVLLHWPDLDGPLLLGLENVHLNGDDGRQIFKVEELALALSKRKLLLGKVAPEMAVLRHSSLHIIRTAEGAFDFGISKPSEEQSAEKRSVASVQKASRFNIDEMRGQLAVVLDKVSADKNLTPLLSQFQGLQIESATLVVEDFSTNSSWFFPDFDALFIAQGSSLELTGGLSLQGGGAVEAEGAASDLRVELEAFYDAEKKSLNAVFASKNINSTFLDLLPIEAEYSSDFKTDIALMVESSDYLKDLSVTLKLSSDGGEVALPAFYEEALPVKDINVSVVYNDADAAVRVVDSKLMLDDIPVALSGEFKIDKVALDAVPQEDVELLTAAPVDPYPAAVSVEVSEEGAEGDAAPIAFVPTSSNVVKGYFELMIPKLAQSRLDAYWPKTLRDTNAYTWMVKRLSKGTMRDIEGQVFLSAERNIDSAGAVSTAINFDNFKGGFGFDNLTIDYRAPMIAISGASGKGVLDYEAQTLGIHLDKGVVASKAGALNISSADLGLTNIMVTGGSKASLDINMNGPVAGAFDFITKEPLGVDHKFKSRLSDVKGSADIKLGLKFPATSSLRVEDIIVSVDASMKDVHLPAVVSGLDLTGGPFTLSANNERVEVTGKGLLDGRDIDLTWMQYMNSKGKAYSMKVNAALDADPNLRQKMNIDLSDFLEGTAPIKVAYYERGAGQADADIEMDLNKARVFVSPLSFEKAVGVRGFASVKASLKNDKLLHLKNLTVSSESLKIGNGEVYFAGDSVLKSGYMPRFQVGDSRGALKFEVAPETKLTKINITAPMFDISPFLGGDGAVSDEAVVGTEEGAYDAPPLQISITADEMIAGGDTAIANGKIYADMDAQGRFNDLQFTGRAGDGAVMLKYAPNAEGAQTFQLTAQDAGGALRAFNMYDDISGGALSIYAVPVGFLRDRNLKGKAQITDFTAVNTPVLARLLGSLSAASDLSVALKNKGIAFTKLEADFDWIYRDRGSKLVLKDGRTSGNSLGLTFKGDYDTSISKVDLSGTIVPLSGVNKALSSIPVVGTILSGGTGSIFAATYTIKGEAKDPKVTVNPLSVLAPGLIRRILFEKN